MSIEVTRDTLEAMKVEARRTFPCEACGILLGEGRRITCFVATDNVHPEPQTRFEIDPQMLLDAYRAARAGASQVIGFFHSHPSGRAAPSTTDIELAAKDGMIWAIYGKFGRGADIRFYRSGSQGFEEVSMRKVED